MSLPFLPIAVLRYNYILHKRKHRGLIRTFPALARLNHYFESTWLNGPFPLRLCNVYNRPLRLRTTNACEGWHNRWNQIVNRVHPNIWYFIICLKNEERSPSTGQLETITGTEDHHHRHRMLNERIHQYKSEYFRSVRTLDEY